MIDVGLPRERILISDIAVTGRNALRPYGNRCQIEKVDNPAWPSELDRRPFLIIRRFSRERRGGTYMPTQAKAEKIEELTDKLGRAAVAILVQTQGLTVKDMNELRNKMRAARIEFQIAKNTLLRIATERNNMTELDKNIFNGQTAVAFGYDDEVATAKAVADYTRTSKVVVLKSGILGGRTLSTAHVEDLAKIPGGKKYAKAQVVGVIQG